MATVFTGIQPTGNLTLGNYLGAIKPIINLQKENNVIVMGADLHSITVDRNPNQLENSHSLIAMMVACGLDYNKSILFLQSQVSPHYEINWFLSSVTPLGWLYRMTQFKEKSEDKESINSSLLQYPVLMAGDILLYSPSFVPVGLDQRQHLELTNDIALRFNNIYGQKFFRQVEPLLDSNGSCIMALDNPLKKMSKSNPNTNSTIFLTDSDEVIRRKLNRAVTDNYNEIIYSPNSDRAGVFNLLTIYQALTGKSEIETLDILGRLKGYGALKSVVADVVINNISPIRKKYEELMKDINHLNEITNMGADRAEPIARTKINNMKELMGFVI